MKIRVTNDWLRGLLWWLPGCLIFFRTTFTTGFDKITGDDYDARLIVFLHEHWVQVAKGEVSWTSPRVFFPHKGTLGYGDTFLLNEVFYLPLRVLGMDQYMAFQWTLILFSMVGFVSMFVLLRRTLSLGAPTCAALATVFTFANSLSVKSIHPQLYAVHWVPLVLLLALRAFRATNPKARLAWGWSAGALVGLLYLSSFYIAWFLTFVAFWVTGIVLVWRLATRGLKVVREAVRPYLPATLSAVVGFGLAMIPFAIIYLPVARTFPDRPYEEAMNYAAWPSDVVNLGSSNYLWGPVLRNTLTAARLKNIEVALALTPILLLAALAACVVILIRRRSVGVGFAGELCIACGITLAISLVLPMKFGTKSLWGIAYMFLPGARSIRAIDRIALVGVLLAVIIVAVALRSLRDRERGTPRARRNEAIGIAVLLGLIVVEQFNVGATARMDRSEQLKAMSLTPAPPNSCRAFYITDSAPEPAPDYVSSIDAMLIAQHFAVPTINGYSGQFPLGFNFFDPRGTDYLRRIYVGTRVLGITEGLCSYDRATRVWSEPES